MMKKKGDLNSRNKQEASRIASEMHLNELREVFKYGSRSWFMVRVAILTKEPLFALRTLGVAALDRTFIMELDEQDVSGEEWLAKTTALNWALHNRKRVGGPSTMKNPRKYQPRKERFGGELTIATREGTDLHGANVFNQWTIYPVRGHGWTAAVWFNGEVIRTDIFDTKLKAAKYALHRAGVSRTVEEKALKRLDLARSNPDVESGSPDRRTIPLKYSSEGRFRGESLPPPNEKGGDVQIYGNGLVMRNPMKMQWNTYAGGTSARTSEMHGYDSRTDKGEYHIWPPQAPHGRQYTLQFANTKGLLRGGLWHEIGKYSSPNKAKGAAWKHYESITGMDGNPALSILAKKNPGLPQSILRVASNVLKKNPGIDPGAVYKDYSGIFLDKESSVPTGKNLNNQKLVLAEQLKPMNEQIRGIREIKGAGRSKNPSRNPHSIEEFVAVLQKAQLELYTSRYGTAHPDLATGASKVTVKYRNKYALVDVGTSGKYMIPLSGQPDAGVIYGIKAYGKIHRGHKYGTLSTVGEWDWRGYVAVKRLGSARHNPHSTDLQVGNCPKCSMGIKVPVGQTTGGCPQCGQGYAILGA